MRILIVEATVPNREASAGERAVADLIDALHALSHDVGFVALAERGGDHERLASLRECPRWVAKGVDGLHRVLEHQDWDVVVAHRPGPAVMVLPALVTPGTVSVYYGHDIHQWRLAAQQRLLDDVPAHTRLVVQASERRCWQSYDLSVYPTVREAEHVNAVTGVPGTARAEPYYRLTSDDLRAGDAGTLRRGLLMVGSSAHAPNLDAVRYTVEHLLPVIDEPLTIVGEWPIAHRCGLEGPRVRFTGRVPEAALRDLHSTHLALLAPLRFGAGSRRKMVAAMGFGLPVVTTTEGTRGLFVDDASDADPVLVGDDPARIAAHVRRLREDRNFAGQIAAAARRRVAHVYGQSAYDARVADMLSLALSTHATNGH